MATELAFPVGRTPRPLVSRPDVRAHAKELQHRMREQVRLVHSTISPRPNPKTLFQDVLTKKRGKEETVLGAMIAVAADPNCPDEQVEALADWFRGELMKYRATLRSLPDYASAWKYETEMNGEGNNAEQDFEPALATRNVPKMRDIIATKQRELRAGNELVLVMLRSVSVVEQSLGKARA